MKEKKVAQKTPTTDQKPLVRERARSFDDWVMEHYEEIWEEQKEEENGTSQYSISVFFDTLGNRSNVVIKDTPEEKKYKEDRDKIIKEQPRKWDHIQKERDKIRAKKTAQALADQEAIKDLEYTPPTVAFEQPPEGTEIGGMKSFHVEKGEEKNTYEITTKRGITFNYLIRAKNEEDAMIRTLGFVSKDGSGQREDVKRPMYSSKPFIREWIDKIKKVG